MIRIALITLASDSAITLARFAHQKEEHSMDQYRSRPKLSENFEGHWSIPFPGEIHMDQSLVPMNFLGKFVWTNGPESSSKVSPYTGIGPWMALPSIKRERRTSTNFLNTPRATGHPGKIFGISKIPFFETQGR